MPSNSINATQSLLNSFIPKSGGVSVSLKFVYVWISQSIKIGKLKSDNAWFLDLCTR